MLCVVTIRPVHSKTMALVTINNLTKKRTLKTCAVVVVVRLCLCRGCAVAVSVT